MLRINNGLEGTFHSVSIILGINFLFFYLDSIVLYHFENNYQFLSKIMYKNDMRFFKMPIKITLIKDSELLEEYKPFLDFNDENFKVNFNFQKRLGKK